MMMGDMAAATAFDDAFTIERGEVSLHVAVAGMPGAAPVVLLHGLGGWHGEWARTAAHLSSTHRVVAFDQRGHGLSTVAPVDLSPGAQVADVVAVLDALGLERAVLVGQSAGGHTAMLTAASHPGRVEHLVMAEAGVGGDTANAQDATVSWFESWPDTFADADAFHEFFGGPRAVADGWWGGLEQTHAGRRHRWHAGVLAEVLAGIGDREHWPEWDAVRAPVTLIRASRSSIPDAQIERMKTRDNVTAATVDAGHDLHLENPHAWIQALQSALG